MRKLYFTIAVFLLLLPLSSCALLPKEAELPTMPTVQNEKSEFTYAYVQRGDLCETQTYNVTYRAVRTEQLKFVLAGQRIEEVFVSVGSTVKSGDLIMTLESDTDEKAVENIKNELAVLELEYDYLCTQKDEAERDYELTLRDLDEKELEDMDTMEEHLLPYVRNIEKKKNDITIKREALSVARDALASRQLRAGIPGTIVQLKSVKPGDVSTLSEVVATISDTETAMLMLETSHKELFPVGQEFIVNLNKFEYPCIVLSPEEAGFSEEEAKNKVLLRNVSDLPDPSNDSRGSLTIELSRTDDILYIEKRAVSTMNGKSYVYVENADGIRELKEVTTGYTNGQFIEITSGLSEGDPVILR